MFKQHYIKMTKPGNSQTKSTIHPLTKAVELSTFPLSQKDKDTTNTLVFNLPVISWFMLHPRL